MNGRTEQTEIKAQNKNAAALPVAAAFLFSLFLAHQILLSLIGQESAALIAEFFAYILFVLSAQAALSWFAKMKNLKAHFIIAGFLTFNVLGLFLSYTAFAGYAPWLRLLVLAALFGFFSALFGFGKRALFIGIVLLGAAANIETGIKTWRKLFPPTVEYGEWRKAFPKKFKEVKFVQKPNVYLISWDALAPPAVLREYLDAPVPEYARYLNNGEFRVFRNAFADRIAYPFPARALHPGHSEGSKTFHNSLLILDPVMWETLPGGLPYYYNGLNFAGQFYYFAGRRPSPLYGIFKDNGYKVLVSYDREYFGEKGPFIDEYLIPKDNAGQCRFKLPWHYFQSLGFCETRRLWAKPNAPATHLVSHMHALIPALQKNAKSGPRLNLIYINSPGHTPLNYRNRPQQRDAFRRVFTERGQYAAQYMKSIIQTVKEHDPDALVLFYGDHGAGLTRDLFSKQDMKDPAKKRFYVLDSHAVMAALYPANACAEYMKFNSDYATAAMLVRALIVCLGGGEDPVDWKVDYSAPYANVRFGDFLYE